MITIYAKNYIESGFSQSDADKLSPEISRAISKTDSSHEKIRIDFSDVIYYTTLFFNQAFTYLIGQWGGDEYAQRIELYNLSESGQETYKHALNYAIDYYAQDEGAREKQSKAISEIINES
jgi:hypothetical protein